MLFVKNGLTILFSIYFSMDRKKINILLSKHFSAETLSIIIRRKTAYLKKIV